MIRQVIRPLELTLTSLIVSSAVYAQAKPQGQPMAKAAGSRVSARTSVRKALDGYRQAAVRGDANGMAAQTTADVTFIEVGQPDIRGRAALESYIGNLFKTMKVTEMTLVTDELTVQDSVASELGHFSETLQESGKAPVHNVGVYLLNWKREADGAWRMQRVMTHPKPTPARTP